MVSRIVPVNRKSRFRSSALVAQAICAAALLAMLCAACNREHGKGDVVLNGDLSHGKGDSPDDWQSRPGLPGVSTLRWHHEPGKPVELEVSNLKPSDAHWAQTLHLEPGWYHFTAEARSEGVPTGNTGATLSIMEGWILSNELHGDAGWQTVGFYLKVGPSGADVELACRLGGFSSMNAGKAFFRNVQGIEIDRPPANASPAYDLDLLRRPNPPAATPAPTPVTAGPSSSQRATPAQTLDERVIGFLEWAMVALLGFAAILTAWMFLSGKFKGSIGRLLSFWVIFLIFAALYAATGCYRRTPYNAHVYLSYAMLHGHFDLVSPPGNFEITKFDGHNYLAYGIGPSLLMLPFVAIWGLDFHQALFSGMLSALAVSLWWSALGLMEIDGSDRAWLTTLFGVGSLFWFYAGENGATWSMMHVTVAFGLMLAIREAVGKRRGWIVGLGFGIAVLARQPALVALPFFAGMLWKKDEQVGPALKREFWFAAGLGALLIFDAYYNYARFGSPFENGYRRLIVFTNRETDPNSFGLFSLVYLRRNIRLYFEKWPGRMSGFPWFDPSMGGFNIFVSTPAIVLAIAANYFRRINLLALLAGLAIQGVYLIYYWTGFAQFGCRYSVDYLPFVMLLAASGGTRLPRAVLIILTLAGIVVEVWGVGYWKHQGW